MIFTLDADGLTVDMSIRNDDTRPFPAGLGLHPYVSREPGTTLQFDADTVWQNGSDALPISREAVAGHWDFTRAREVTNTQIDECYAGWGGTATVDWPSVGRRLTIETGPPFDHIQLYTPPLRDFFGLEPVSNMPDAVNRMEQVSDNGLRILAPGDTLAGSIRMSVSRSP
jgi:aldose 1-epimerase